MLAGVALIKLDVLYSVVAHKPLGRAVSGEGVEKEEKCGKLFKVMWF
jgi:hypothetical protein